MSKSSVGNTRSGIDCNYIVAGNALASVCLRGNNISYGTIRIGRIGDSLRRDVSSSAVYESADAASGRSCP